MKKIILTFLCMTLTLTGCTFKTSISTETIVPTDETIENTPGTKIDSDSSEETIHFNSLDDQKFLEYLQDSLYADLECEFGSDDYIIESLSAIYFPKEYLEEVAYNTKSNIWFGYTLDELEEQFEGTPYIFTLASDGSTEVVPLTNYDDTYEKVIKNIAVGTGVILICVTVSVVSAGVGATKVSTIFAASAKEATEMALKYGAISTVLTATITGIQTKDFEQTKKETLLQASESFKWGAITGAVKGGVTATIGMNVVPASGNTSESLNWIDKGKEAEKRVIEIYGGDSQKTYLAGKEVPYGTAGATRPDIVREVNGTFEAIEVKNYDLSNSNNVRSLCKELLRQVSQRIDDLPNGYIQRIVLDVTDRDISYNDVNKAVTLIQNTLNDIYPNIPIDIIGG